VNTTLLNDPLDVPRRNVMQELLVDFITSLDGYGAAEGWPGVLTWLLLAVLFRSAPEVQEPAARALP